MPYFVRVLISFCVGGPAVVARILGLLWACVAGTLLLIGPEEQFNFFGITHTKDSGAGLFAIGLVISVAGYLVDVGVAYINSEHRQAVPPREIAVLIVAELAFQVLGIVAACCLIAAAVRETADRPLGHPAVLGAGVVFGLATLFLSIRYRQRINDWRAAWKNSAAGDFDLNRQPPDRP